MGWPCFLTRTVVYSSTTCALVRMQRPATTNPEPLATCWAFICHGCREEEGEGGMGRREEGGRRKEGGRREEGGGRREEEANMLGMLGMWDTGSTSWEGG